MKKILIVEDNKNFQHIWNDRLTREGFEISQAVNGREALEILSTTRPDLVLLDMVMPEMGGDEVLATMQKDEGLKSIPVLVMSVLEDAERVKNMMQMGARGYFIKGTTSPNQLALEIKKILQ